MFVDGQGVPPEIEADGADGRAVHSVVLTGGPTDGEVVGTGRLLEEAGMARLGRIAVRSDRRGSGVGVAVVRELEGAAAAAGLPRLLLHAQAPVVDFYARLGWTVTGPVDLEAGIEHRWMTRDLLPGLRPVCDADAAAVQTLVGGCFAEYPGCVLEVEGLDAWMLAPGRLRPELRVLPAVDGGLAACVGWAPAGPDVELKSLYVGASYRRRGYAAALVGLVERTARERGALRVVLWTDTRFLDAHRLYERLGYVRGPGERPLHDVSQSIELPYAKIL